MVNSLSKDTGAKSPAIHWLSAAGFIVVGLAVAALGIYIGDTDDAPGAALLGIILMIGLVTLGVRRARRKS